MEYNMIPYYGGRLYNKIYRLSIDNYWLSLTLNVIFILSTIVIAITVIFFIDAEHWLYHQDDLAGCGRSTRDQCRITKMTLVIKHCRTENFSRSFLLVAFRLKNLLPSGGFSGDTFGYFKSAVNFCLHSDEHR